MQASYFTVFLKDTSILIVIAYLLSRGRLLRLLFRKQLRPTEALLLGVTLGLISLGDAFLNIRGIVRGKFFVENSRYSRYK